MWAFGHPYLKYEVELTKYDVASFKYQWKDGLFSVTLGLRGADGYRKAFFHPMASNAEFVVNTKILQNETLTTNIDLYLSDFVVNSVSEISFQISKTEVSNILQFFQRN